jgi:hypothetical protein
MRKITKILPLILIFLVLAIFQAWLSEGLAAPQTREDPPSIPHQVYGLVRVNGAFVPAGTSVSAWCGMVRVAEDATIMYEGQAWYNLDIPAENAEMPGCSSGDLVSFMIGNLEADQTLDWVEGGISRLDLLASGQINLNIYLPLIIR